MMRGRCRWEKFASACYVTRPGWYTSVYQWLYTHVEINIHVPTTSDLICDRHLYTQRRLRGQHPVYASSRFVVLLFSHRCGSFHSACLEVSLEFQFPIRRRHTFHPSRRGLWSCSRSPTHLIVMMQILKETLLLPRRDIYPVSCDAFQPYQSDAEESEGSKGEAENHCDVWLRDEVKLVNLSATRDVGIA